MLFRQVFSAISMLVLVAACNAPKSDVRAENSTPTPLKSKSHSFYGLQAKRAGLVEGEDPYPGMACTECHDDRLSKTNKHPPAAEDCTYCHSRHGTETGNPARLYEKINATCLNCHDMGTSFGTYGRPPGGHPVAGHSVEGPKDKLHPEREMSCASCHNPHSSDMPSLFRYDFKKEPYAGQACAVCHFDIYYGNSKPVPPTPPWE